MFAKVVRETGSSDTHRAKPGDFDAPTRLDTMKALLRPEGALEQESAAHAFWTRHLRRVIGAVVIINIVWGTRISAQENALEILRNSPGASNRTHACTDCRPPVVASTGSSAPTLGPWDFPPPAPPRRLDGSSYSDPPTVYGMPFLPVIVQVVSPRK